MMGALQFRLISEGCFVHIASPDRWGKTGVEFVTLTDPMKSGGTTNRVILITDGVEERDLGMVMVYCHHNQARIEACDALSTLNECNSSELSMVVVRRYSNTPYIPRGTNHSLYLDMDIFQGVLPLFNFP